VDNVNQKVVLGVACILASLVLWLVPIVGCLLCNVSFIAGLVLVVLGIMEEQGKPAGGTKKGAE